MLRIAAVVVFASLPVLGAIAPGGFGRGEPPSSLEPGRPRGKLKLTHQSQRVIACVERRSSSELSCEPKLEQTDTGTQLTLKPISESGTLAKEERRSPVRVRFEDESSPQTKEIELAVGLWEVDWGGLEKPARFRVADEDEFGIELASVAGGCTKNAAQCVVSPAGQTRKVAVPARYRAR